MSDPEADASRNLRSSRFRAIRAGGLVLVVATALIHPLARLSACWSWRADLLTHFQEPALAATLIAIVATARRHRRLALALATLLAVQAWPWVGYLGPNPVPACDSESRRLRIVVANLFADNADYPALIRLVRRERPDVVGLVEFAGHWQAGLAEELRPEYPYRAEVPAGHQGLALWFREPPADVDWQLPVPGGWPWLHATLSLGGRVGHLWLVHLSNPVTRRGDLPGQPELADLADRIARTEGPRIVVGDLNCTDGSPHFARFLKGSGLRDSRLGFGRQASWPVWSPYRIAIDHALVSPDLAVVDRRLGPEIGSDHLPILVDVAWASGPGSARKAETQVSQSHSGSAPANLTRSAVTRK